MCVCACVRVRVRVCVFVYITLFDTFSIELSEAQLLSPNLPPNPTCPTATPTCHPHNLCLSSFPPQAPSESLPPSLPVPWQLLRPIAWIHVSRRHHVSRMCSAKQRARKHRPFTIYLSLRNPEACCGFLRGFLLSCRACSQAPPSIGVE